MAHDAWASLPLGKLASEITVGFVGSMVSEYRPTGIPFLRSQNIEPFRINSNDLRFIGPEFHARIKKSRIRPGDVVIVRTGTPGISAVVPDWLEDANCADLVIVRTDNELDAHFLVYYLNSVALHHIDSRLVGAVQQHFNVGSAREVPVVHPPVAEQRRIVGVLRSINDKIELNQRMNQTLESMARAIFRSWFVDFDPVVAKAAGRQPFGMSSDVAALFPKKLIDAGIVTAPLGWQLGRLDDLIVLQRGYDLPATKRTAGIYPVLSAGGPTGTHCEFKVRGPGVTTGRSGQLGDVYFVHEDFWPLNTSLYVKEFRASSPLHAYFLLQTLDFDSFNAGSAVPTLNRNHVHNLPVVVPPEKLLTLFKGFAGPLFDLSHNNETESRTLAALRDTLLPKLMSGELRVREAEKLVGTHV